MISVVTLPWEFRFPWPCSLIIYGMFYVGISWGCLEVLRGMSDFYFRFLVFDGFWLFWPSVTLPWEKYFGRIWGRLQGIYVGLSCSSSLPDKSRINLFVYNDKPMIMMMMMNLLFQANVRVLVSSWHVKKSSSSSFRCCKISTLNLQKDRILLMCMKYGDYLMYLLSTKLDWLRDMHNLG